MQRYTTAGRRLLIPSGWGDRANNLDAIRLAMALLVVWSHSFALYYGTERDEPISLLLSGSYNAGNVGVMVFFIVSGFLIPHSFSRSRSLSDYFTRRAQRICPGYLAATTVCAFAVIPLFSTIRDLSPLVVAKTFAGNLLLRNYFPPSNAFTRNTVPNVVNGSLWSIPFEAWCYVGVAVLGLMGLLGRRRLLVAGVVGILIGRVVLDLLDRKPGWGVVGMVFGWPYLWFKIAPSFLLGMIAYAFRDTLPRSRVVLCVLGLAALAAAHSNVHVAHLIAAPALAYAVFYVAFGPALCGNAVRFGDFSYGTYLYAFPVQQMIYSAAGTELSFGAYVAWSLLLSLTCGVASWFVVERWFLRRSQPKVSLAATAIRSRLVATTASPDR